MNAGVAGEEPQKSVVSSSSVLWPCCCCVSYLLEAAHLSFWKSVPHVSNREQKLPECVDLLTGQCATGDDNSDIKVTI